MVVRVAKLDGMRVEGTKGKPIKFFSLKAESNAITTRQ